MTADFDPKKITRLLTQSSRQLDEPVLSALAAARHNALDRQSVHAPAMALSLGRWTYNLIPHSTQQWVATALLLGFIAVSTGVWQHAQDQHISELDVAILTDELPIDVFVD